MGHLEWGAWPPGPAYRGRWATSPKRATNVQQ